MQRKRGEWPKQQSKALHGLFASPRAQGGRTQNKGFGGQSLACITCPRNQRPLCFSRPWKLLRCSSCAAKGTHRCCSSLRNGAATWECDGCAGAGTGKRQSTRVPLRWGQFPAQVW